VPLVRRSTEKRLNEEEKRPRATDFLVKKVGQFSLVTAGKEIFVFGLRECCRHGMLAIPRSHVTAAPKGDYRKMGGSREQPGGINPLPTRPETVEKKGFAKSGGGLPGIIV